MDINNICPNCMNEIEEGKNTCGICGYTKGIPSDNSHALKPFTILQGKYLVGNVIGEGGFGITYIGYDLNLELKIAIKEFYPNGFVTRESEVTSMVTNYTGNNMEQYDKWKTSFVREARSLAKFSNLPGIVGVRDFFTENNTAYIVMEYVEGETLKEHLKKRGGKLEVAETLDMIKPVIRSLAQVHSVGIIHRDISPDNIMIENNGDMVLIDFGAARDFTMGGEKSLSVLLKPGYAPEEQYRSHGEQGPWSDVYAICGTIYRCITGNVPAESMERMRKDSLVRPSDLGISIDSGIENSLMKGMAVFAEDRYQNMDELFHGLYNNGFDVSKEDNNTKKLNQTTPEHELDGQPNGVSDRVASLNDMLATMEQKGIGKKQLIAITIGVGILLLVLIIVMAVEINGLNAKMNESRMANIEEDIVPKAKDKPEGMQMTVPTVSVEEQGSEDIRADENEPEWEELYTASDDGEDVEVRQRGTTYVAKFKCRDAFGVNTSKGEKGSLIKGVRVIVREGAETRKGSVVGRAVSDKDGRVEMLLAEGIYTIEFDYSGYIPCFYTWNMSALDMDKSHTFYMCPDLDTNEMSVVMTWWDENAIAGQKEVNLNLSIMNENGVEIIDVDDNDSRCESARIDLGSGEDKYKILVKDMTNDGNDNSDAMSVSDVHVCIYSSKGLLKEYVYSRDERGTEWEVAEIIDENRIMRINEY